ncbi:MAG: Bifunctional NMN adenylyltransferase/Nudix hydrolase [Desulfovibrio sp.]
MNEKNTASPCPCCGRYRAPSPTVDAVIYDPERGIVLVKRKNEPFGWALPGGFVEYGESVETAAMREAKEETSLDVRLTGLLGVYSDPARDPRQHTISTVFTAVAANPDAVAGNDDAEEARFFLLNDLPQNIVFDHCKIIDDFKSSL